MSVLKYVGLDQKFLQSVFINSVNSKSSALSGVSQGPVLASLLFSIFISDSYCARPIHSTAKLYTEDILIYAINSSPEDCLLQSDLALF